MEVKICQDRLFASCQGKLSSLLACSFSLYMQNSSLLTAVPESQEVIKNILRLEGQQTENIIHFT